MNGSQQSRLNNPKGGGPRFSPAPQAQSHPLDLKATISYPFEQAITTWAEECARRLIGAKDTATALRRFFNEFADMAAECRDTAQPTLPPHIATRLKMLIPRVLYAHKRQNAPVSPELATLLISLVNYSSSPLKLAQARDIFEAVLGYAVGFGIRNR